MEPEGIKFPTTSRTNELSEPPRKQQAHPLEPEGNCCSTAARTNELSGPPQLRPNLSHYNHVFGGQQLKNSSLQQTAAVPSVSAKSTTVVKNECDSVAWRGHQKALFSDVLREWRARYEAAPQKKKVAENIVRELKKQGYCFIRWDSSLEGWVVDDNDKATKKVRNAFQEMKKLPTVAPTKATPTDTDILCVKGRPSKEINIHNTHFREKLKLWKAQYESAVVKKKVAASIVEEFKKEGCRFLLQDGSLEGWIVADNDKATSKIIQAFHKMNKSVLSSPPTETQPTDLDIFCVGGASKASKKQNTHFHATLKKWRTCYEWSPQKKEVAKSIVGELQELGCRFLREDDRGDGWTVANNEDAILKVMNAFRYIRDGQTQENRTCESLPAL